MKTTNISTKNKKTDNVDDNNNQPKRMITSQLTKSLKLNNLGLDDNYFEQFKAHNIKNTLYPINGVCYFVGQKGSSKTYTLSAIIQYAFKMNEIARLIYIYADNVDTTIIRALPRSKILSIPKQIAADFLCKFLNKKTKFTSCYNFLYSANKLQYNGKSSIKDCDLYIDNLLEQLCSRKKIVNVNGLITYANKIVNKYKRGTILTFNEHFSYDIGNFDINQYDMICIDDIGQFLDLFGTTRKNSEIYRYFTITRQNKTAIYLTGQEIKQLPKMLREMLGAVVMLNGTNINEMDELKIPYEFQTEFRKIWSKIKKYEGILYNFNDKEYEWIKYN